MITRTLKIIMVDLKGTTFEFNIFKHSARFHFVIWQALFSKILISFLGIAKVCNPPELKPNVGF